MSNKFIVIPGAVYVFPSVTSDDDSQNIYYDNLHFDTPAWQLELIAELALIRLMAADTVVNDLIPPDSKPAKTRQTRPQGPPKEGE